MGLKLSGSDRINHCILHPGNLHTSILASSKTGRVPLTSVWEPERFARKAPCACAPLLSRVWVSMTRGLQPARLLCHGISQARVLECAAISFSRGPPHPGTKLASPALAGGFFPTVPPGKAQRGPRAPLTTETVPNECAQSSRAP